VCRIALLVVAGIGQAAPDPAPLVAPAARAVDFTRDIEPIFAEHCHACHGPKKQKSDYRIDLRESAMKGGESGEPPILPGRSADSPLIHFVSGIDADLLMPPKKSDQARLTPEQIALLRAWIDQGAVWPESAAAKAKDPRDWWSLKPIVRPPLPEIPGLQQTAIRNSIDAFIAAKLEEKGLARSPEADRQTLVRRLYFDLIGLPPTADEVDSFAADPDPEAYEKLVDRLLASPRHGERWARHWLDVVHFGETHGYDKDKPRPNAWPYRDYVIRAFNEDKPYARFVQEQIAGDVLFPNTADGMEALGFIAAGPWDFIGHAEVPETKIDGKIARHLDRDDMVSNTINTFCSLTVHCAQCHNHKFDPIPQEDYYRLQAVFSALDRTDKTFDLDPAVAAQRQDLTQRQRDLKAKKAALDSRLAKSGGRMVELLDRLINEGTKGGELPERTEFGWHSSIEPAQDAKKWVQVDLGSAQAIAEIVVIGCHDNFNQIGAGFGFPMRFKIEVSNDETFEREVVTVDDQTQEDFPNPGVTPRRIPLAGRIGRYVRVTAIKLAPRKDDFIFALAEVQALDPAGRNIALGAAVTSPDSIEAAPRWSRANLTDGYYYRSIEKKSREQLADLEKQRAEALAKMPASGLGEELAAVTRELSAVDAALRELPPPHVAYIGAIHHGTGNFAGTGPNGGKPRPIFILARGDVTKPGKEAAPGALTAIGALAERFAVASEAPESERRAALARWLTDAENPLTWRSIVNRVWQYHFGRGIVDTPNDFGHMGQLPTHPELLDWLAAEFRDGGGSMKKLHRLIVTSAAYRQSSASRPDFAALDAGNAWLWRQNRRKLEAEAIRDSLLAVAGKLDLTMGGPSFQDFVIEKPEHSPHYQYQLADPEDPQLHRRSIYRFLVRSQQQPFMAALDCADPSMLVEKRNQTITPLQALTQLNNQLALTMAKHFAARVEALGGDLNGKVSTAFRLALSRKPDTAELDALVAYAHRHGLTNTCRAILNLNEFAFAD
jgi:mono/diheme cytochrome c family protein